MVKLTDEEKEALSIVQDSTAYTSDFVEKWEIQKHKYRDHDFGGDEDMVDQKAFDKTKKLRKEGWKVRKSCVYSSFARTYMCRVSAIKRKGE